MLTVSSAYLLEYLSIYSCLKSYFTMVSVAEKITNLHITIIFNVLYNNFIVFLYMVQFLKKCKMCKNSSKILNYATECQASPTSCFRSTPLLMIHPC